MSDDSMLPGPELPTGISAASNGPTKRITRSYATEAAAMRSAIGIAVMLLGNVKCEKGSQDTMNAVVSLLKGSV